MGPAGAAHTAGTGVAGAGGWLGGLAARGGGKDGQFFGQFGGTAFGAGRPFPAAGTNEQFAVGAALLTMELVNRHGGNVGRRNDFGNGATPVVGGRNEGGAWRTGVWDSGRDARRTRRRGRLRYLARGKQLEETPPGEVGWVHQSLSVS